MRVQIVENQPNHRDIGVGLIHQPPHLNEVLHGALPGYRHVAPAPARLTGEEQVARPSPLVFVVLTPRPPRLCRQRFPHVGEQLGGGLVKADHRPLRIVGLGVEIQHVLHGRHELSTYLGDAPLFLEPRLERVFFSRRRTVSGDKDSTNPNSTTLPARARMVQWS